MMLILVGIGGCIGAMLRFWFAQRWNTSQFPWGTLLVNLFGAFILGWLVAKFDHKTLLGFCGGGILGALTTFSTIQIELLTMIKHHSWRKFFLYFLATYILGIVFGIVGFYIGSK